MALQAATGSKTRTHEARAHLAQPEGADREPRFQAWRGKSGTCYLHRVYSLLDCPALPEANFILVKRDADQGCLTLAVGQTSEPCGSANLASLRHHAALRGANEIHIFQQASAASKTHEGRQARDFIEQDLRAAQFEQLITDLKAGAANSS